MSSSKKVFNNFMWRLMERFSAQGVTLIVSVVLARLLEPSVYGVVALVTVFTIILQVFIDSGLGNALIQKKDADDIDFSTVFFFNIVVCLVLYALMFFAAPLIADFYQMPELTALIRVLSLTLIISGVKNIQQAYVAKNMIFKKFFFATLGGTIGAAAIGITMAYFGFGVWALAAQYLFNATVDTVILWLTVKWRPKRMFSWDRLKILFSYGWKLSLSSLIDVIYTELRQLIIGKMYQPDNLAYYNQGQKFPNLIVTNIITSLDSVLFPAMSSEQDSAEKIKTMMLRTVKVGTYFIAPLMIGIAFIAEPLVTLVFTEKWLPCVPFLRVFCVAFILYPVITTNSNAIKALGRSDISLKQEIFKKIISFALLFSSMWFGVMAIAYSLLLDYLVNLIVTSWPNKGLVHCPLSEQIRSILPSLILATAMGLIVYPIVFLPIPVWAVVLLQIVAGAGFYVGASALFRFEVFRYILGFIKHYKQS